jgi:hypothetical protein
LIGELQIANQLSMEMEGHHTQNPKLKAFSQRKRVLQCALNLAKKLDEFIAAAIVEQGSAEADAEHFTTTLQMFRGTWNDEVKELASSPFGGTLVATIGQVYNEQGRCQLDSLDSIHVGIKKTSRSWASRFSIASSGIKAAFSANAYNKMQQAHMQTQGQEQQNQQEQPQSPADVSEEMKQKMQELSGHMASMMWQITRLDIESTLAKVCRRVLHDHAVDENFRKMRARALVALGEEFKKSGVSSSTGIGDLVNRMKEHMQGPTSDGAGAEDNKEGLKSENEPTPGGDTGNRNAHPAYGADTDWTALSVRQLKEAVEFSGLSQEAVGFTEKGEYISLLISRFAETAAKDEVGPSAPSTVGKSDDTSVSSTAGDEKIAGASDID